MSYALSPSRLNINPAPFASGGFGDVYTGSLDGSSVCIKRVRVYSKDGSQNTAKVHSDSIAFPAHHRSQNP